MIVGRLVDRLSGLIAIDGVVGVLAPHVTAPATPVTAHGDQQRRRPPPERLVRQSPGQRVARRAFAAAAPAPAVGLDDATCQDGAVGIEPLTGDLQTELVQPGERGQIRTGEASIRSCVSHVGTARDELVSQAVRMQRWPTDLLRAGHRASGGTSTLATTWSQALVLRLG
jgi:hypothetical protein